MIKRCQILQSSPVTKFILILQQKSLKYTMGWNTTKNHLRLHHVGSLRSQQFNRRENIHDSFEPHSFQNNAQTNEHASPTNASAEKLRKVCNETGSNRSLSSTHLQCTVMGPSWPNCSLVLCTWPMNSMKNSPDFGTPWSGHSVYWKCLTVFDCPVFKTNF